LFVGRTAALGKVLDHLGADETGERCALVVTGEPGAGKSAVLGRIVRTALDPSASQTAGDAPAAAPGLLDCAVHLREKTLGEVADEISTQLGADPVAKERNDWPTRWLDGIAQTPAAHKGTLRVVFDALDESRDVAAIARQVITPLVEKLRARVVVGSRHSAEEALSVCATTLVDLNHPDYFTAEDLMRYARRVLRDDPREGNPYRASETATLSTARGIAAQAGENFLVTRLIAARRAMADSSAWLTKWNDDHGLSAANNDVDISVAFLDYLAAVDDQAAARKANLPAPTATLLTPLAFARGEGFTLDVWRRVLLGLARIEVTTSDLADLLAGPVRDFVVTSNDTDGNTRARLYHQELTDTLKRAAQGEQPDASRLVFDAVWAAGQSAGWASCDGYVRNHLMDHAVEAGRLDGANREVDQVYLNDEFLLVGESESLLRAVGHAIDSKAQRRASLLSHSGPTLLGVPPAQRWQTLMLGAAMHGMPPLSAMRPEVGWPLLWAHQTQSANHKALYGHSGLVRSVVFGQLANGTAVLLSGDVDGDIRIWNRDTGEILGDLATRTGPVWSMAIATLDDGMNVLVTGGADGHLRLWSPDTGESLRDIAAHSGLVMSVAYAVLPDGTSVLASGGKDGRARLWDPDSGELVREVATYTYPVWSVAIGMLDDGTPLVACTGGLHGQVSLTNPATGQLVQIIAAAMGPVLALVFGKLDDGTTVLATGTDDGHVKLWSPTTGNLVRDIAAYSGSVWSVNNSSVLRLVFGKLDDGTTVVVSGGEDGHVKVWNAATGDLVRDIAAHNEAVHSVDLGALPDGTAVLASSGGVDGVVRLWALRNEEPVFAQKRNRVNSVASLCFGELGDGTPVLASGEADGHVKLWDPVTGEPMNDIPAHDAAVSSVAFGALPDGRTLLATGCDNGQIKLWNPDTTAQVFAIDAHSGPVSSVGFGVMTSRGVMATGGSDGYVRLWDSETGSLVCEISADAHWVRAVAFGVLPDGTSLLAYGGCDGVAQVQFTDDEPQGGPSMVHGGSVLSVAFGELADGSPVLASGGFAGHVKLWDPVTGVLVRDIHAHDWTGWSLSHANVTSLAFGVSPDGTPLLATGGGDGHVRLWNPTTGALVVGLAANSSAAWSVAFGHLPDETTVLAAGGPTLAVFRAPDTIEPNATTHDPVVPPYSAEPTPAFTTPTNPGRVFITWAHGRGAAGDRTATTVAFTQLLRNMGLDADLDQFHDTDAASDWNRWGPEQVRQADMILAILSPEWVERFEGTNDPTVGPGAAMEANAMLGLFATNQGYFRSKLRLVILPCDPAAPVPHTLHGVPRFTITDITEDGVEDLYRNLTQQPAVTKPAPGPLRHLPPRL
jgi:WD40 repeat protein